MDLNDSPVTACEYVVDCPGDLIPNLYVVGSRDVHSHMTSCRGGSRIQWVMLVACQPGWVDIDTKQSSTSFYLLGLMG